MPVANILDSPNCVDPEGSLRNPQRRYNGVSHPNNTLRLRRHYISKSGWAPQSFRILIARCVLALGIGLTASESTMALTLGAIELESVLNEPLHAQIKLDSILPQEIADLKVSMGSTKVFNHLGMSRPGYLNTLKFEPKLDKASGPVIIVTSEQPIKEPFLNFLVEVHWPKGRLLQEYTLLLDPPVSDD